MCLNLNQMLHSNLDQPETNVHSLMCCPLYFELFAIEVPYLLFCIVSEVPFKNISGTGSESKHNNS